MLDAMSWRQEENETFKSEKWKPIGRHASRRDLRKAQT